MSSSGHWNPQTQKWSSGGNLSGTVFSAAGTGNQLNASVSGDALYLQGDALKGAVVRGGLMFDSCVNTSVYKGVSFRLGGSLGGTTASVQLETMSQLPAAQGGGCTGSTCSLFPNKALTMSGDTITIMFSSMEGTGSPSTASDMAKEIVGVAWKFECPANASSNCAGISTSVYNVSFVQ